MNVSVHQTLIRSTNSSGDHTRSVTLAAIAGVVMTVRIGRRAVLNHALLVSSINDAN
jgi:hypothetical protein